MENLFRLGIFAVFLTLLIQGLSGCGSQPQLGDDEQVFHEVDALYTAVTSKSPKLLDECHQRLIKLNEAEKISQEGFRTVSSIIQECKQGGWTNAAPRLYKFMRGQRRESTRT